MWRDGVRLPDYIVVMGEGLCPAAEGQGAASVLTPQASPDADAKPHTAHQEAHLP